MSKSGCEEYFLRIIKFLFRFIELLVGGRLSVRERRWRRERGQSPSHLRTDTDPEILTWLIMAQIFSFIVEGILLVILVIGCPQKRFF